MFADSFIHLHKLKSYSNRSHLFGLLHTGNMNKSQIAGVGFIGSPQEPAKSCIDSGISVPIDLNRKAREQASGTNDLADSKSQSRSTDTSSVPVVGGCFCLNFGTGEGKICKSCQKKPSLKPDESHGIEKKTTSDHNSDLELKKVPSISQNGGCFCFNFPSGHGEICEGCKCKKR